jgi:hypothetical protein
MDATDSFEAHRRCGGVFLGQGSLGVFGALKFLVVVAACGTHSSTKTSEPFCRGTYDTEMCRKIVARVEIGQSVDEAKKQMLPHEGLVASLPILYYDDERGTSYGLVFFDNKKSPSPQTRLRAIVAFREHDKPRYVKPDPVRGTVAEDWMDPNQSWDEHGRHRRPPN